MRNQFDEAGAFLLGREAPPYAVYVNFTTPYRTLQ